MKLRYLSERVPTLKLIGYYLLALCLCTNLLSCSKNDDVEPGGDFVKFKVDGREVSQADAKSEWELECRFLGDATVGYRFQLGLSTVIGDAPSFAIHFHTSEKYEVNKNYTSIATKVPNTYSYADFKVPTDDLIIKQKNFIIPGGVTITFTNITEDRVTGKFTVNANQIFDPKQPSITDGEFSAKRNDY